MPSLEEPAPPSRMPGQSARLRRRRLRAEDRAPGAGGIAVSPALGRAGSRPGSIFRGGLGDDPVALAVEPGDHRLGIVEHLTAPGLVHLPQALVVYPAGARHSRTITLLRSNTHRLRPRCGRTITRMR